MTGNLNSSIKKLPRKTKKIYKKDNISFADQITLIRQDSSSAKYPLTYMQERMWNIEKSNQEADGYFNITIASFLKGKISVEVLREAFKIIINRHEIFRTFFKEEENGTPVQKIIQNKEIDFNIALIDHKIPYNEKEVILFCQNEKKFSFNLENAPLLRVFLLCFQDDTQVLIINQHHMISDEVSISILWKEVKEIYNDLLNNKTTNLSPMLIKFKEYSKWQRTFAEVNIFEDQLKYWQSKIKRDFIPVELPTNIQSVNRGLNLGGGSKSIELNSSSFNNLKKFCSNNRISIFMLLITIFKITLFSFSGQKKISVGTPIANRTFKELENVLGYFANKMILCTRFSGDLTFLELINSFKETFLEAYTNQNVPFEKILSTLDEDALNYNETFFKAVFIYQGQQNNHEEFLNISSNPINFNLGAPKFKLLLSASETETNLSLTFTYQEDLFTNDRIQEILSRYIKIMEEAVKHPYESIDQLINLSHSNQKAVNISDI